MNEKIGTSRYLLVGAVVTALIGLFVFQLVTKPIKYKNNVAELVELKEKPPVVTKDTKGFSHVEKEVIYVTNGQASLLYRSQLDSLKILLKTKDKQILSLTTASGTMTTVFVPQIKDTSITYESKWVSFRGSTNITKPFTLTVRDSINLVFIKQRYGFLNLKEKVVANLFSGNKNMVYYNVNSWKIPEISNNKAVLGFGVTAGYGIQLNSGVVTYGPQITGGLQLRF